MNQLKDQQTRRKELESLLDAAGSAEETPGGGSPSKNAAPTKSEFAIFMNNMSAGLVEVTVYFADIISDVQVRWNAYKGRSL